MDLRKKEQKDFYNKKIRDEVSNKRPKKKKLGYEHLAANKKFYSITRKSKKFVNDYLTQDCLGKRTLDYCCGDGGTALFLAEHGAKAIGVDISDMSIKNAKAKALRKKLDKQVSFYVMDAESLKFEDNYFDLIVCNGVLHHLNIKKAYPELMRVLKPEGKIICDEPLVYNPIFQLYRRMTPHLRTDWEMHHILGKKDIKLAEKYFRKVEVEFFHLATLLAVPFRRLSGFNLILKFLEGIDSILLKTPLIKWLSWQIVFILSEPKKFVLE